MFKTKVLGFISPKLGLGKLNDPNPRGFERVSTNVVIGMDIIGWDVPQWTFYQCYDDESHYVILRA